MLDPRSATPAGWARYASGGSWTLQPHLALLNRTLLEVAGGSIRRLLILMPPRHGKSEFVSGYFPSWYLGVHPDNKIILSSYEATFAAHWGEQNRSALEQYGPEVFGVKPKMGSKSKSWWKITGHQGQLVSAGARGSITGKGAHGFIVDDPVKNEKEANSEVIREDTWNWYLATARTRLEPGGWIIVIQTRWHDDDLGGRLLKQAEAEKGKIQPWTVIHLPAIAEETERIEIAGRVAWRREKGEALWPDRYSLDDLHEIATEIGAYWWSALFQGRPMLPGGGLLKVAKFREYEWVTALDDVEGHAISQAAIRLYGEGEPRVVRLANCTKFQIVDLATSEKTSADYTVITTFALVRDRNELVVLDVVRDRMEGPDIVPAMQAAFQKWRPSYVGVESVAFQASVAQDARRGDMIRKRPSLPVREIRPRGDKMSRAITLSARMDGGQFYLPRFAPWKEDLLAEVGIFDKGKHDDQVDTLAYAAEEISTGLDRTLKSW